MSNIPKWLIIVIVGGIAVAVGLSIFASVRNLRVSKKARALVDSGQVKIGITDAEKVEIARQMIKLAE